MFTSQVFTAIEITEIKRRAATIRFTFVWHEVMHSLKMLWQGCKKIKKTYLLEPITK